MRLSKHVIAAAFAAAATLTALAPQAMAVPLAGGTSTAPTAVAHPNASVRLNDSGTFTVRCGSPCYQ
ncbi:hypothetical protein [Streptomyces sp. NBC_00370]|uniref:hypothetical protein n=1 Tax=Streptomyces sp. NBC_00370 TaxID=2975728 RepID=UPI002E25B93A